jgi:hypothetical protein
MKEDELARLPKECSIIVGQINHTGGLAWADRAALICSTLIRPSASMGNFIKMAYAMRHF